MAAVSQSSVSRRMATSRNQNDDDDASSNRKRLKTCDNGGAGHNLESIINWSDLNHNLLYLVMMKLGVVDYLSFGGVYMSWRSLALSNRNIFMASKPPMTMYISWRTYAKSCSLKDFEGRKYYTILHNFSGGVYVGLTCGYLIFLRRKNRDFLLVNPITRHQHCFTDFPVKYKNFAHDVRAILVYSRSVGGWVFVVMNKSHYRNIWLSIVGKGAWYHISGSPFSSFTDLCAFKGTIYALNSNPRSHLCELYELRFDPDPKLMLLETKNSLKPSYNLQLVSSGENIYVMDRTPEDRYRFHELDFGEMTWVLREKRVGESAAFLSNFKHGVADKPRRRGSCGEGLLQGHNMGELLKLIELEKSNSESASMWYFPHECLNVDLLEE